MCIDRERRALALRVAINGFFLLLGSRFAGSHVLEFVGITLPVFCALPGGWWSLRSAGRSSRPKGSWRISALPRRRVDLVNALL